jgi:hypothetical protein
MQSSRFILGRSFAGKTGARKLIFKYNGMFERVNLQVCTVQGDAFRRAANQFGLPSTYFPFVKFYASDAADAKPLDATDPIPVDSFEAYPGLSNSTAIVLKVFDTLHVRYGDVPRRVSMIGLKTFADLDEPVRVAFALQVGVNRYMRFQSFTSDCPLPDVSVEGAPGSSAASAVVLEVFDTLKFRHGAVDSAVLIINCRTYEDVATKIRRIFSFPSQFDCQVLFRTSPSSPPIDHSKPLPDPVSQAEPIYVSQMHKNINLLCVDEALVPTGEFAKKRLTSDEEIKILGVGLTRVDALGRPLTAEGHPAKLNIPDEPIKEAPIIFSHLHESLSGDAYKIIIATNLKGIGVDAVLKHRHDKLTNTKKSKR